MSIYSEFLTNSGRPIFKWSHYFFAYERHFGRLVGKPCTFLEIGAGNGGSSQMWKRWLGPLARIITVDITEACRAFADDQIEVRIGDQSDPVFLQALIDEFGTFDAVLDDGSHHMNHVPKTFDYLYPRIANTGVYMIEDMHTSYWADYGGGLRKPGTMVEKFKALVDGLNTDYHDEKLSAPEVISKHTIAMTAYDSILVFERAPKINKSQHMIGDHSLRIDGG